MNDVEAVYGILNKKTGKLVSIKNKCGWKTEGYAKSAFTNNNMYSGKPYNEQVDYLVVKLIPTNFQLDLDL